MEIGWLVILPIVLLTIALISLLLHLLYCEKQRAKFT